MKSINILVHKYQGGNYRYMLIAQSLLRTNKNNVLLKIKIKEVHMMSFSEIGKAVSIISILIMKERLC